MTIASLAIAGLAIIIAAIGAGYAKQSARAAGRSASAAERSAGAAEKSLREAQIAPLRQKQYELLGGLANDVAALMSQLEGVNRAVQEEDGAAEARSAATTVDELVQRMTTPVVTDAELERRLEDLKHATLATQADAAASFVERIRWFAGLMDRLHEAREQPIQARNLEDLAKQRGGAQEPLRRQNSLALASAERVRERLREIEREGLGEL